MIAVALFLLPWVAMLLVLRQHLDSGAMVAAVSTVAAASISLPTLWLAWATLRESRRSDAGAVGLNLGQVADQLAVAVGAQWKDEAALRRLNDPFPLPVSWTAADPSLTDSWESLVTLATSGAGWPSPQPGRTCAAGQGELAGEGGQLVDVLARVPTGRLVVLGEPGAGKTMLMVRLVLDLLARRVDGGPVPILAPVASWNPAGQDLRDWLGARLLIDHPALANPPPGDMTQPNQAAALLARGLILPILDGLDEIPDEVRGRAISRINGALRPGGQLVVTCRSKDYQDAVRPQDGVEVTLRGAAAVQLRPLDVDAVSRYLREDAAGPVARGRWDPVLAVLGTEAPAGQALSTPLMVSLACEIYNPRPGELAGTLRDPAELSSAAMADRESVESLLFDAFVPAVYKRDPTSRWRPGNAERWLTFLARHLEDTIASPDLAWWQLPLAISLLGRVFGILAGVMAGVVAGIAIGSGTELGGAIITSVVGVIFGIIVAAVIAAVAANREPTPVRGIRWRRPSGKSITAGIGFAIVTGIVFGVLAEFTTKATAGSIVTAVLIGAIIVMIFLAIEWLFNQKVAPQDLASAASPQASLSADRKIGIALGVAVAVAAGLIMATSMSDTGVIGKVVIGGFAAVLAGIVGGFGFAAWPSYGMARIWLALHHRLPWLLMDFFADAHRRGVLRQAGAFYQFRHIELQRRLANRGESVVTIENK